MMPYSWDIVRYLLYFWLEPKLGEHFLSTETDGQESAFMEKVTQQHFNDVVKYIEQ